MREVKYRALGSSGIRKGKWWFGSSEIDKYKEADNKDIFLNLSAFERLLKGKILNPETRGQCTGLTDKSGNEIYEGDTIEYTYDHQVYNQGTVKYSEYTASFELNGQAFTSILAYTSDVRVIGNIHEAR